MANGRQIEPYRWYSLIAFYKLQPIRLQFDRQWVYINAAIYFHSL
ncbi:Uncharacterised protein [Serratia fonticola]|nr:hypothetical protein HAP32_01157 [Serratia fonticola]RDL14840.1 hypothetical protein DFO62_12735 [Serratia fonticola]CAI1028086.1 Uncharacterised protein [Serratia fonticola]CAI1046806.1 Uncharacterised protein [Serratia fonticola]